MVSFTDMVEVSQEYASIYSQDASIPKFYFLAWKISSLDIQRLSESKNSRVLREQGQTQLFSVYYCLPVLCGGLPQNMVFTYVSTRNVGCVRLCRLLLLTRDVGLAALKGRIPNQTFELITWGELQSLDSQPPESIPHLESNPAFDATADSGKTTSDSPDGSSNAHRDNLQTGPMLAPSWPTRSSELFPIVR